MSNLEEHLQEQAEITAACEAGTCDHPECEQERLKEKYRNAARAWANDELEIDDFPCQCDACQAERAGNVH